MKARFTFALSCFIVAAAACVLWAETVREIIAKPALTSDPNELRVSATPAAEQAMQLFSVSPALFAENQGQWVDPSVRFVHKGNGANVAMTDDGPVFEVFKKEEYGAADPADADPFAKALPSRTHEQLDHRAGKTRVLRFSASFVGAHKVKPVGLQRTETVFNYHVGDDPSRWKQDVPTYEVVAYKGLYDGIDLHTWGKRSHLKYEFHVAPGSDWRKIRMRYRGIKRLSITEGGSLKVNLGDGWGSIVDDAPYVYQQVNGKKVEVPGRFVLIDDHTYAFDITGRYNPALPLIIDPDLVWSTYLGGSDSDWGYGIAVDASGVYVTGWTESLGWTSGGFDPSYNGGNEDAFVAKLTPSGGLAWSTYLGGSDSDWGYGIAVDASGVYVTGLTTSSGWTSGGFDTGYNGAWDAFVAKLTPSGGFAWSTYLGGNEDERGFGIAVDASGVYVTGRTESLGWTSGGFDTTYNGGWDAFVAKLTPSGGLAWSTYLGGSAWDEGFGIAVDASGVYVTGGHSGFIGGRTEAFVAKLTPSGGLAWSTYLGGGNSDCGYGIAVDASGVYVTGSTTSSGWTFGGFDTSFNGVQDAFVVKLTFSGGLAWSTYVGGSYRDIGWGIAVDASGVYMTGVTTSSAWASGGFDTSFNGVEDAFVVKLTFSGGLAWSTYVGGSYRDMGSGIAVDASGVYVMGLTVSSGWTPGGFDTSYNGDGDAFVAKISEVFDWRLTGSAAYDLDTSQLSLTAYCWDLVWGEEVTDAYATYSVPGIAWGTMSYSAGRWRASASLPSLNPGTYDVEITMGAARTSVSFTVPEDSGAVSGRILDTQGVQIASAVVSIYDSIAFYQPGRTPIDTCATTGDGQFTFTGLKPNWYIIEAETPGYLTGRTPAFRVLQGSSVTQDLILSQPSETLGKLLPDMVNLRKSVLQTMLFENNMMVDLTVRATDDLGTDAGDLGWSALSMLGDVLDPAGASLSFLVGGVADQINNAIIGAIGSLAPEVGLRGWTPTELRDLDAWTSGEQLLADRQTAFEGSAGSTTVDSAFDFGKAARMIGDQRKVAEEIRCGRIPLTIPLADPEDGYIGVGLPAAMQTYLFASASMNLFGGVRKIATTVQVVSGGTAVALAATGVGGAAAGTVFVGATAVKEISKNVELIPRTFGAFIYIMNAKDWATDVNSLPGIYISTADLLMEEASSPDYLHSGHTYSATATMDLNETVDLFGKKIVVRLFGLPLSLGQATVDVTNTGNVPSVVRVRATGQWDYRLPSDWPVVGGLFGGLFGGVTRIKVPTSSAYATYDLEPSASHSFSVPYRGFYVDPINLFSPHTLEVDVYSGPFLCDTIRDQYYVASVSPLPLASEQEGQTMMADMAPSAGFKQAGEVRIMDLDDFAAMIPTTTIVIDGTLSADAWQVSQSYTVGPESWSVEFSLYGDPLATIALQVYDADGFVVGNVPAKGGAVTEFVATYNGSDADPQIVEIPAAAGRTYTVKAVLLAADTQGPFDVKVYADEVPVRPAVLAITPSELSVTTRPGYNVTVPVLFGEAGHQQPLGDVAVNANDLLHTDVQHTLTAVPPSSKSFGGVKAGASDSAEFVYEVPFSATPGRYEGQVTVDSSNAGTQALDVSVLVVPMADVNEDCTVNVLDLIFIRNRLNQDATSGDNWKADVNDDGKINILDLISVRNNLNVRCE